MTTQITIPTATTTAPRPRKSKQPDPASVVTDVTLPKRDIVALVSRVASVANPKSPHPMMKLVLLRAESPRLHAMATDGYTSIATHTDAMVAKAGAIAVDGKDLLERAKAMPDGPVRLTVDGDGHVSLSGSGKLAFKMGGVLAADFPVMPSSAGAQKSFAMKAGDIDKLFNRALFAVAEPGSRMASIEGLHIYGADGVLTLEATDGNMLTRVRVADIDVRRKFKWLIPKKCVAQVLSACADGSDGLVEFAEAENGARVFVTAGAGVTSVAVATLSERFPDLDAGILPNRGVQAGIVTVGRKVLADSVRAVSVAAARSYVEFSIDGTLLSISTRSAERGDADDELEVAQSGPPARFGLSAAMVGALLGSFEGDDVDIAYDPGADGPDWRPTPVTLRVVGDTSGSAACLVPMRTDWGAARDKAEAGKKGKGK